MSRNLQDVDFSIIRYANCWEDAGLLLQGLADVKEQRIAIVASAGDNALALLATNPAVITAFDISLPQLHLTELKQVAIDRLGYDEVLLLLGLADGTARIRQSLFDKVSPVLSSAAKDYWQHNPAIGSGVCHAGKFERYFRLFRRYLLPLVHSNKQTRLLLTPKTAAEQEAYYRTTWNSWRWKALMQLFFSSFVMGRAGRDPAFLKHVQVPVATYIRQKAEAELRNPLSAANPFLHYIFTGSFGPSLPHYLRPEYYPQIKANIGRLSLRQGSADEIVKGDDHHVLCLSNIFEYFAPEDFQRTVSAWAGMLSSGTQLLFWNLMARRSFAETSPENFRAIGAPPAHDNGFFYSAFLHEQKT